MPILRSRSPWLGSFLSVFFYLLFLRVDNAQLQMRGGTAGEELTYMPFIWLYPCTEEKKASELTEGNVSPLGSSWCQDKTSSKNRPLVGVWFEFAANPSGCFTARFKWVGSDDGKEETGWFPEVPSSLWLCEFLVSFFTPWVASNGSLLTFCSQQVVQWGWRRCKMAGDASLHPSYFLHCLEGVCQLLSRRRTCSQLQCEVQPFCVLCSSLGRPLGFAMNESDA